MSKKKGLGRGLGALIDDPGEPEIKAGAPLDVRIDSIQANPLQPRTGFRDKELRALADSIQDRGVLEPLVVRRRGEDGYELIAGERRLRAAKLAGLTTVPVIVRDADGVELLELALIENLHREDLNAIEEAESYQRLAAEFERTQVEIARLAGKDRSTVANFMRLLALPDPVKEDVRQGRLTQGHARALLTLGDEERILAAREKVLTEGLSVRETEKLVGRLARGKGKKKEPADQAYYQSLSEQLTRTIGAKTAIRASGKKGRIVINYNSIDQLEKLLHKLGLTRIA